MQLSQQTGSAEPDLSVVPQTPSSARTPVIAPQMPSTYIEEIIVPGPRPLASCHSRFSRNIVLEVIGGSEFYRGPRRPPVPFSPLSTYLLSAPQSTSTSAQDQQRQNTRMLWHDYPVTDPLPVARMGSTNTVANGQRNPKVEPQRPAHQPPLAVGGPSPLPNSISPSNGTQRNWGMQSPPQPHRPVAPVPPQRTVAQVAWSHVIIPSVASSRMTVTTGRSTCRRTGLSHNVSVYQGRRYRSR